MHAPDCFEIPGRRWSRDEIRAAAEWLSSEAGPTMILLVRRGTSDDPIPIVALSIDRTLHDELSTFVPTRTTSFLSFAWHGVRRDLAAYKEAASHVDVGVDANGQVAVRMGTGDPASGLLRTLTAVERQMVTLSVLRVPDEKIARLCGQSTDAPHAARAALLKAVIAAAPEPCEAPLDLREVIAAIGLHRAIHLLWTLGTAKGDIALKLQQPEHVITALLRDRHINTRRPATIEVPRT